MNTTKETNGQAGINQKRIQIMKNYSVTSQMGKKSKRIDGIFVRRRKQAVSYTAGGCIN